MDLTITPDTTRLHLTGITPPEGHATLYLALHRSETRQVEVQPDPVRVERTVRVPALVQRQVDGRTVIERVLEERTVTVLEPSTDPPTLVGVTEDVVYVTMDLGPGDADIQIGHLPAGDYQLAVGDGGTMADPELLGDDSEVDVEQDQREALAQREADLTLVQTRAAKDPEFAALMRLVGLS